MLEPSRARLDLAQASFDLGVALVRGSERLAGRERLAVAADLAEDCGAVRLAEAAQAELRVAGAKPRRRRFSGVDALTASERRIADLAIAGQTNREIAQSLFITPKTAENHLGRAYGKLGISSRRELAAALVAGQA
ncbi:MAG: helix-turn-helix transcriptional regulator [Solirubrobacterales bacterium]|nr:helix-turn-helix transcriptional regulator [Solirubrobacterales bacterium]